jgi:hypothetical protein
MDSEPCIRMLKALADETRWAIVRELLAETLTVSQVTERVKVSQYNASKHLRILREADRRMPGGGGFPPATEEEQKRPRLGLLRLPFRQGHQEVLLSREAAPRFT